MIGNRVMFGFVLLFLTLVINISTAPILDKQLVEESTNQTITTTESFTYEDNSSESNETSSEKIIESTTVEYKEETTIAPEVTTNDLLFVDTTEVYLDIDEILKITDRLFSENQDELPSTPTTESPDLSQSNIDDDDE
jgi:hypothetical protein